MGLYKLLFYNLFGPSNRKSRARANRPYVLSHYYRLYYTVFIGIRLINLSINKSIRRILIILLIPSSMLLNRKLWLRSCSLRYYISWIWITVSNCFLLINKILLSFPLYDFLYSISREKPTIHADFYQT